MNQQATPLPQDGNTPSCPTCRRRMPRLAKIFYGIALATLPFYLAFFFSEAFSDWFNRHISSLLRGTLAHLTGWIPFSLAEYLILLLPLIVTVLAVIGVRRYSDSWRNVGIYCASLISVGALVFALFAVGFAPAYRGTTLDQKLELERTDVSVEELYQTALLLSEQLAEVTDAVTYDRTDGFSVMPYGYEEMNERLMEAYDLLCQQYDFVSPLHSRVKPVMLSNAMSYTHITGVYTFFTGEANINVAFPDYTLPFTAAHELAHQRGIAREDEANFMAFLACMASSDDYLHYAGYLNLLEYVLSALRSASLSLYVQAYMSLPNAVIAELTAYADFFDQYRDSAASNISETVNNTFLTMHGTEGTKSYGMVVDLAVAYFRGR